MAQQKFIDLARLLLEIMSEGEYSHVPDNPIPEEAIMKTADALELGHKVGAFVEDEEGRMYYSGMVEHYGGHYELIFEQWEAESERK